MTSDAIAVRGVNGNADLPTAGQITAGEWNDLQNWKDWLELTTERSVCLYMFRIDRITLWQERR